MKQAAVFLIALLASVLAPMAGAHTTIASAKPDNGAVLNSSPPTIEIRFKQPVRMTSIVVIDAGNKERKLGFTPLGSSDVFTIDNPELGSGRNELQWKALSKDGHVMNGRLVYVIKAENASP